MSRTPDGPRKPAHALLEAARHDHEPSAFDRARVRHALSHRIEEQPSSRGPFAALLRRLGRPTRRRLVALAVALGSATAWAAVSQRPWQGDSEHVGEDDPAATSTGARFPDTESSPQERSPASRAPSSPVQPAAARPFGEPVGVREPGAHAPSSSRETEVSAAEVAIGRQAVAPSEPPTRARPRAPHRRVSRTLPATEPASPAAESPKLGPPAAPSAPPAAPTGSEPVRANASEARSSQARARPLARDDEHSRVATTPSPPSPATGLTELSWLQRIQDAVREEDWAAAARLSDLHTRRWPDGRFVQESEGIRALAACEKSEAQARRWARAFLRRYPQGTLAARVRSACLP